MNKKFTSTILAALMIVGSTSISSFAAMANGTVVIGNKAFDLNYANDNKNQSEINAAVVVGGGIYVKDFQGNWIDNSTALRVSSSILPAVIYKNAKGVSNFAAADQDQASPVLNSVSLTIGKPVSATKDAEGNYRISLAGMSDTDMFTGINLKASENTTVTANFKGSSKTVTTNNLGDVTIIVADLLGSLDPQRDGISVRTLKSVLLLTKDTETLTLILKDLVGHEKTVIITITAK